MEFTIVLITLIVIPVSFYCSLLFQIINIICYNFHLFQIMTNNVILDVLGVGGCFVIFLKSIKGIFFAKKGGWGGGCFCQIRKLPGYFFKVEGVGGGERHDFRKPIIKSPCPPPPPPPPPPRILCYKIYLQYCTVSLKCILFLINFSENMKVY